MLQRMSDRDCTHCDHFALFQGFVGGEYTGGSPGHIGCDRQHWTLGDNSRYGDWTAKEFRLAVLKGETCADFKRTED
jgi:hypothetical protein